MQDLPPLSILIKPASGNCNLRCRYCFYHALTESRIVKNYGIMTSDLLERIVRKALAFADGSCTFAFQGGEPTLAGLGFFEDLITFQKKYNGKGVRINNAIQTNGMIIDEGWASFFAHNRFLVGLSLDGPKELHDRSRIAPDETGSFSRAINAIDLFDRAGVEYNILCVVTKNTARHAQSVYNFLKKRSKYLQFIPCIDPLEEERGCRPYSLTPQDYEKFLKTTFDLWYRDAKSKNPISVRWFDNILGMVAGQEPEACGMSGVCGCQFIIEADGSVYPCDFYVTDRWRLGNILEDGFLQLRNSDVCAQFIEESRHLHPDCRICEWYGLCRGGCKRDREPLLGDGAGRNYFCESYKSFFAYSLPRFRELARKLIANCMINRVGGTH